MYVTCFSTSSRYDPGCFENPEATGEGGGEEGGDALKAPSLTILKTIVSFLTVSGI